MARRNPYAKYHTDSKLTKEGIWYQDEDVRIKVTYAGTENSRYDKMLKAKLKPYETQIRNDNLSDDAFHKILAEVYAACVILDWQVKEYADDDDTVGTWVQGIYDANAEILPFTEKNVCLGFELGNRLFMDVIKVATNFNLFRQGQKDEDAKN